MSNESPRLIASVTLVLPNRQIDGRWQAGNTIKAGQTIPLQGLEQSHIDGYVQAGNAYWEGAVPLLQDVEALQKGEVVNVSAKLDRSGNNEDNPLDDGIDLVSGTDDPALDAKLSAIAEQQKADGVENDGNDLYEERSVEINAGTGEVVETGGEPSFEDEADAQVG